MIKTKYLLLVCFCISFISANITATGNKAIDECNSIHNECKKIEGYSTTRKIQYVRKHSGNGKWQKPNNSLKDEWLEQIDLFVSEGKLRSSAYFSTDPGGDVAQYIEYYFRKDGSTAFIIYDYRVAAGLYYQALTHIYIDSNGKIIEMSKKFIDLDTKKEIDGKGKSEGAKPEIYLSSNEFLKKNGLLLK